MVFDTENCKKNVWGHRPQGRAGAWYAASYFQRPLDLADLFLNFAFYLFFFASISRLDSCWVSRRFPWSHFHFVNLAFYIVLWLLFIVFLHFFLIDYFYLFSLQHISMYEPIMNSTVRIITSINTAAQLNRQAAEFLCLRLIQILPL